MPETIVTRLLRLAGYAHELDETTSRLTILLPSELQ